MEVAREVRREIERGRDGKGGEQMREELCKRRKVMVFVFIYVASYYILM